MNYGSEAHISTIRWLIISFPVSGCPLFLVVVQTSQFANKLASRIASLPPFRKGRCKMKRVVCTICLMLLLVCGCGQFLFPELVKYQKERYQIAKENVAANSTNEMKEHISGGVVVIGMNKDEVIMSWGFPRDINKSVGSWGVHEQWVYRTYDYITLGYFYFENGVLTSWSN